MKNKYLKVFLAAAALALMNTSYAGTINGTVITVITRTNTPSGVDKSQIYLAADAGYTAEPTCQLLGSAFLMSVKNLSDPGTKAQFDLLLTAKISALPVSVTYHLVNGSSCSIDDVVLTSS